MSNVFAVGCKLVLKVHTIAELDPVLARAKKSGLALPEDNDDYKRREAGIDRGQILEIGPSCSQEYIGGLKVGDYVAFAKYAGKLIEDPVNKDIKVVVINDEDVVAGLRGYHD